MRALLTVLLLFAVTTFVHAEPVENLQERLLYATTFEDWTAIGSSSSPTIVEKTTNFSNETVSFTLQETQIAPAGVQLTRFKYVDGSGKGLGPFTIGYAMAAKSPTAYIETSVLQNISKVTFVHGATGSNRGWKLLKKGASDADWVVLSEAVANPADGVLVECVVNESNVALRLENITSDQNAYLSELNIFGMVALTAEQVSLQTSVQPENAGSITVSPVASTYDKGSSVHLSATRAFGYSFVAWMQGDSLISNEAEIDIIVQENTTLTAVFNPINTYTFACNIEGSLFGRYSISPEPTNGRYEAGTNILITPHSNEVMTFLKWEDGTTSKQRVLTITQDTTLTATWSEIDYLVGWDFYSPGNSDLASQFYSESTNTGLFTAVKLDDATQTSWLEKSGFVTSEGKNCAILWKSFEQLGQYGFQTSFGTQGASDIDVLYDMMSSGYSTHQNQILQYSIDSGMHFINYDTIYLTGPKSWSSARVRLPAECEGLEKLYLRWIADVSSEIIGSQGNDGTSISNIFVLCTKEHVPDTIPPTLINSTPAHQSTGASASGSVILTFNEKVFKGEGSITLNQLEVLEGQFGSSNAIFAYSGLRYGQSYTIQIPAGSIVDQSGNAFAGIELTFRVMEKTQPAAQLFHAIVAADGSGDYTSVAAAIDAAPNNLSQPHLIFIKEGTYKEHLQIDKAFIHLIGQSAEKVVITDDQLCGSTTDPTVPAHRQNLHVSQGATVVVNGSNFYAENISFENGWGVSKKAGPQALALYTTADKAILHKCKLRFYQDTYLTSYSRANNRHYLKDCLIEGAVDFIYGGGNVLFDACTLYINRNSGGYITAPSHAAETQWGYVFLNNTIDAPEPTLVYYGRPWQNKPKVSFVNTQLTKNVGIYAAGWHQTMGAIPAVFADYNTIDWQGNPVDLSNRNDYYYYTDKNSGNLIEGNAKSHLTDEEVSQFTRKNVLGGDDDWMPGEVVEPCAKPMAQIHSTRIEWSTVPYAICYVICKNGSVVGFTTDNYFDISSTEADYTIQAVSAYGSLSEAAIPSPVSSVNQPKQSKGLCIGLSEGVRFEGLNQSATVHIYRTDGLLVGQYQVSNQQSIQLPHGLYLIHTNTSEGTVHQKVQVGR